MTMTEVTASDGGSFQAYIARPTTATAAPAIIVIQEIFGVNDDVRKKCDDWAAKGYVAIAPDLFWRQTPNVQLNTLDEAEWAKAFALLQGFNVDKGIEDLAATLAHLKAMPQCTGAVGAVGYCLGGRMAYLMATRTDISASVGYYGVTIENYLAEASCIKNPLLLHVAEEDEYVSKDAQAQIAAALGNNSHTTLHSYAGVNHAFSRLNGKHYDAAAATLANSRTTVFFEKHLKNKVSAAA